MFSRILGWLLTPWYRHHQEKQQETDRVRREQEERFRRYELRLEAERQAMFEQRLARSLQACLRVWGHDGETTRYTLARDKDGVPVLVFARWKIPTPPPPEFTISFCYPEPIRVAVAAYYPGTGAYDQECLLNAEVRGPKATIQDIKNSEVNKGLGSLVLTLAEEVFSEVGAIQVNGLLSDVDYNHRDRQIRFYEKNRYTVTLAGKSGAVTKDLSPTV